MSRRDARAYLSDIVAACDDILRYTSGRTAQEYRADDMLRRAVERCFEIAGEALRRAIEMSPTLTEHIAQTERIVGFRNRLIRGYETISSDVVWGIVQQNVPTLRREAADFLESLGHR